MLYQVAEKLATDLKANLPFSDKVAGLVKVGSKDDKRFPIAYNMNPVAGDNDHYTDLVPDSSKTSILYFMDQGTSEEDPHNHYTDYRAVLKLVVWVNYTKINEMITTPIHNDSYLVAEVRNKLTEYFRGYKCIAFCHTTILGQDQKDGGVFSAFTNYNEQEEQYYTYPYDYFSLNLDVYFRAVKDCTDFTTL